MPEIRFCGHLLIYCGRILHVGKKRENRDAPKVSVLAARLNFNTPYRVIGDLSAPRRRVNQTENDRRLSSSYKFRRFDLSAVDHAYPNTSKLLLVCFTGISCHEKLRSIVLPSLHPWPFHARKPREPRKHVNSIKTLRTAFSYPVWYMRHLISPLVCSVTMEISFFW